MPSIHNQPVPAAGTFLSQTWQLRPESGEIIVPAHMLAQFTFTYGSGGTSLDAYLQTSLDGGTTWNDVVHPAQFLLASVRYIWPAGSIIPALTSQAALVLTDGALGVASVLPGLFGGWWRVKYVVVGTYVASTLRVDLFTNVSLVPSGPGTFG